MHCIEWQFQGVLCTSQIAVSRSCARRCAGTGIAATPMDRWCHWCPTGGLNFELDDELTTDMTCMALIWYASCNEVKLHRLNLIQSFFLISEGLNPFKLLTAEQQDGINKAFPCASCVSSATSWSSDLLHVAESRHWQLHPSPGRVFFFLNVLR